MFRKAMCSVSLLGCALVALGGCSSGKAADESAASGPASMAVLEADWFYDDDGSVIVSHEKEQLATAKEREAVSVTCKHFTVVAIEILPNGKVGAMELKAISGLAEFGKSFTCKSISFNHATGEATIDFGFAQEDCCEMLVEMLGGVTRFSCSGDCDNGENCGLESGMDGEITTFTCQCPDVP